MRLAVVGAGAWGLPAAAELARRHHEVFLIDQHGPLNAVGSSGGASRIWRLAHPDRERTRLAIAALAAWRRLEGISGEEILLRRGILWRDSQSSAQVASSMEAESVDYRWIDAAEVGRVFPGMRANSLDAVWQPEAGVVLATQALAAQFRSLESAGGRTLAGWRLEEVHILDDRVELLLETPDLQTAAVYAEAVVLAPGPWAAPLLPQIGIDLALWPRLEQVTYLQGRAGWEDLPCWFEGASDGRSSHYAMPTPGLGYKIGLDHPLRPFEPESIDRTPEPAVEVEIASRARDDLGFDPVVTGSQVCSWTASPDGRFVIDRLHGGRVVLACGDSGEGFKFSALMGEVLADLAEGLDPSVDIRPFGLARFAGGSARSEPPALGR